MMDGIMEWKSFTIKTAVSELTIDINDNKMIDVLRPLFVHIVG